MKEKEFWESRKIETPKFDFHKMVEDTKKTPKWIHFGAGNIFRGFIANLQQELLDKGSVKEGIIAADTFDFDIIDKIYKPFDDLTMLVLLKADGTLDKKIIASIAESLKADSNEAGEMARFEEIFVNPTLQMVSFTITEKGYALSDIHGNYFPWVLEDMEKGPKFAKNAMTILTALMYKRYLAGKHKIALVSMDNCSHNGEKLQHSVLEIAKEWIARGYVEEEFLTYLTDETYVSFPWSMIDKITPRPSEAVATILRDEEIEQMDAVITSKNTYIAPYVNAEIPQYLVVEDKFPNGRPPLEEAGVFFTNRDTVNNVERMKVTTCLNPLHTALAIFGCLLGFDSISAEMKDEHLKKFVTKMGYKEGMPVVTNPGIITPESFIKEVITQRLPNPFIPDTPQRIACDTSQKMAIRFGETIKAYDKSEALSVDSLTLIPLVIAGWCRYLTGKDDNLETMELSNDPLLENLTNQIKDAKVGSNTTEFLVPILSNKVLFGCDLYQVGLGKKVETMFVELMQGKGAVRKTLEKYLPN